MIESKSNRMSTAALLMFCFILYAQNAVGSIIQTLIDTFPVTAATGRLAATLPCLGSCITALIAGLLAGNKIRYRTFFIFSCVLWTVGGLMPIFFHSSFNQVLLGRFIFGLGTGFGLGSNAYIVAFYPPEKKGIMLGLALAMNNGGGVLVQVLGGWLGEFNWVYPFYLYLFCPVVLVFVALFLKEPERTEETVQTDDAAKRSVSGRALLFLLVTIIDGIMFTPMNAGTSIVVADWSLGGSFVSGIILAVLTIGGVLAGYVMNLARRLGRFEVSFMLLLISAGYLCSLRGRSVFWLCCGALIAGIGYYSLKPLLVLYLCDELTAKSITLFTTLLYAGSNLGIFFSNSWISLANRMPFAGTTEMESAYNGSMIVFAAAAVLFIIFDPSKRLQISGRSGGAIPSHQSKREAIK